MSRLTLNPAAKPARLCGTLRPSSENKGRGLTLARQAPVPGWTPSLLRLFKGALSDQVQASALLRTSKPVTQGVVPLGVQRCDLTKRISSSSRSEEYFKMEREIRVRPHVGPDNVKEILLKVCTGGTEQFKGGDHRILHMVKFC